MHSVNVSLFEDLSFASIKKAEYTLFCSIKGGRQMSIIITILTALVALEFVYIFYLETLQTTSEATSRVFNMSVETLKNANITTLFKNQGVYNLMIAVGLVFGLIVGSKEVVGFLLLNIIVVAVYGGLTSQISIIWKQGGLAIVTFILLLVL